MMRFMLALFSDIARWFGFDGVCALSDDQLSARLASLERERKDWTLEEWLLRDPQTFLRAVRIRLFQSANATRAQAGSTVRGSANA
jgi:hypothetical protein